MDHDLIAKIASAHQLGPHLPTCSFVVRQMLDEFAALRASGSSWKQLAGAFSKARVQCGGGAVSSDTLRGLVSRSAASSSRLNPNEAPRRSPHLSAAIVSNWPESDLKGESRGRPGSMLAASSKAYEAMRNLKEIK